MKEANDFAYEIEHFTDKQLKESICADMRDGISTYVFMLPSEQQRAIRESQLYQDYENSMEDSSAGFEDYMRRLQVVLAQREEFLQKAEAELKEEKEAREKRVDKIKVPTKKKAARVSS